MAIAAGMLLSVVGYAAVGWCVEHYFPLSPEGKISKAYPLSPELTAQLNRIESFDDSTAVQSARQELDVRLRLRAMSCVTRYVPVWYQSIEQVRTQVNNASCFSRQDTELTKWAKLIEIGLILRQGVLRPIPIEPALELRGDAFIHDIDFAANAGIALLRTRKSIQLLDMGNGETLYSEPSTASYNMGPLSPNGRLFTVSNPSTLFIKETQSGRTLLEIPEVPGFGFYWLDDRTAAYSSSSSSSFLDFSHGQFIKLELPFSFTYALPLSQQADHYLLWNSRKITKVTVSQRDTNPQIKIIDEVQPDTQRSSFYSPAINQRTVLRDSTYVGLGSANSLVSLSLQTLQARQLDMGPLDVLSLLPMPASAEVLVEGRFTPYARDVDDLFVVDLEGQRIASVAGGSSKWRRLKYVKPLDRLGMVDEKNFVIIEKLPLNAALDVADWRGNMIEAAAERKLLALTRRGPSPLESTPFNTLRPDNSMSTALIAPSAPETQVEVVGVYESANGKHGGGVHLPGVIEVDIKKTAKPLTLVLSSYEPIIWKLRRQPGSTLQSVVLSSYHPSVVEGADDVRVLTMNAGIDRSYATPGYQPLPLTLTRITGQAKGLFQGAYSGKKFMVGGN